MIEKITILNSFTTLRDGCIQVQLASFFSESGKQLSAPEFHRCVLEPGCDPIKALDDLNASLPHAGKPALLPGEWDRLLPHIELAHTPQAVKDFLDRRAETAALQAGEA